MREWAFTALAQSNDCSSARAHVPRFPSYRNFVNLVGFRQRQKQCFSNCSFMQKCADFTITRTTFIVSNQTFFLFPFSLVRFYLEPFVSRLGGTKSLIKTDPENPPTVTCSHKLPQPPPQPPPPPLPPPLPTSNFFSTFPSFCAPLL